MIWKVSRRSVKFPDDLKSVQIIQKMYAGLSWGFMLFQERVAQKQFWIPNFNFHFLTLEQEWFEWILGNFKSQIWDLYCKHCLSAYGAYLDHAYAQNLAKPPLMRICRKFENRRDLRVLSGKFLRQKSCYPESFRFLWLCICPPSICQNSKTVDL